VFERAEEGTLLIDEIGDLPIELQAKLLRVIERRRVTRVGGDEPIGVDVRLLAATRRDLDREVQHGRFRDDLFHRIAVARIELPSLRERVGDVSMLARHFWTQMGGNEAGPDPRLLRHWEDYDWPGNVRELRNAVARRLALGEECELLHDELALAGPGNGGAGVHSVTRRGDTIRAVLALELPLADARQRVTREFEQRYVEALLEAHDGNVTRAAAAAGVTRRQFQRLKSRSEGA
jgi:DNA-binding NtrC family response regulator